MAAVQTLWQPAMAFSISRGNVEESFTMNLELWDLVPPIELQSSC